MLAPFGAFFHLPPPESLTASLRGSQGLGFMEEKPEAQGAVQGWSGTLCSQGACVPLQSRIPSRIHFIESFFNKTMFSSLLCVFFSPRGVHQSRVSLLGLTPSSPLPFALNQENISRKERPRVEEGPQVALGTFAGPEVSCSCHSAVPQNSL